MKIFQRRIGVYESIFVQHRRERERVCVCFHRCNLFYSYYYYYYCLSPQPPCDLSNNFRELPKNNEFVEQNAIESAAFD